jgi:high affinity sulfate transporter 1
MIPVGLAFGELAGSPLAGLYAEIFPLVAYAIFGTSRQLIVGPGAAMSAFVALSVAPLAGGDADKLIVLISLISIMIGILCIAGSFLRLGFFADFLSNQVVVGFMHGLALVIAVSQLPLVLGFEINGGTTLKQFFSVCNHLSETNVLSMVMGLMCALIIIVLHKVYPAFPGQIIVLVGAILAVHFFSLEEYGIAVVGNIPHGIPDFNIPMVSMREIQTLIPVAFAAAIVAFSDTMANSRGFADRNHYRVDADQELLALGMGNISAGITQSLPVSGSGTRTSVAEAAGSKTQVTSIFAALTVALILVFFTDLLYSLPMTALGGILLAAAWNLINIKAFKRMWEFRGVGLISALMTMIGVVSFGIIQGIGIGVLFSLVLVVRAVAFPTDTTLGRTKDLRFRDEKEFPEAVSIPGIIVYRFSGVLIFANSGIFRNRAEELISHSHEHVKGFVLDASGIIEIDMSACEMLSLFHKELEERGIRLIITKLRKDIRHSLIKGWLGPIDKTRLFKKNVREAVLAIQS